MRPEDSYTPIGDYAVIGDCRSAALISREGSLDWLCWPRFDSPSVFAALLDRNKGGSFVVRPTKPFTTERRYLKGTAVLETTFSTDTGVVRLSDVMPVASDEEKRRRLRPDHELLRTIDCTEGQVEVEVVCSPRPDYGRVVPRLTNRRLLGIFCGYRYAALTLHGELELQVSADGTIASGRVRLRRGDRKHVSLTFAHGEPAVLPVLGSEADQRIAESIRWWRDWTSSCVYQGPYREAVLRSALTLKLLTYAPSGAVVAAPTTSLPEAVGGVRNWDYRYCWLRDASLTLQALYDLGYSEEAEAFLSWLLHTTRMTRPELQVVYNVFGEKELEEIELDHLEGYAGSSPVRVGNAAAKQLQLDTYGEVADAVYEFVSRGGTLDRQTARLLVGLGKTVCRRWREPDDGIWEKRGGPQHHTYSKVMCWVALDRLLRLHDEGHLRAPVETFRQAHETIRAEVEARGYSQKIESYTAVLDGDDVDASLLLLGRYGYVDADSPRMLATYDSIRERLIRDGLVHRYLSQSDGLPPGEGAFGICSFWGVESRARQGRLAEATESFETLLAYANDVGLFAEELDPETGSALGNFPQAFTHVGLIDAALTLAELAGEPGLRAPEERQRATEAQI